MVKLDLAPPKQTSKQKSHTRERRERMYTVLGYIKNKNKNKIPKTDVAPVKNSVAVEPDYRNNMRENVWQFMVVINKWL